MLVSVPALWARDRPSSNCSADACDGRHLDPTGSGICDTQEFYIHKGAANSGGDAKDGQNAERLGLEHRKEETERTQRTERGSVKSVVHI